MRIIKVKNYDEMSLNAARIICGHIALKPNCVLGLATGSTPIGTYANLVKWYKEGGVDFSETRTVNLDEYFGISPDNENSYSYFMYNHLLNHVNIKAENINIPNGMSHDTETECERYDRVLDQLGSIDLQLLGIGHNGHVGFNEPSDIFVKKTHAIELSKSTIKANSRLFNHIDEVPTRAFTMGMQSIMKSKEILLIASGQDKADIMYEALCGPITPQVPASALQLHQNVIVIGDEAALSKF